MLTRFPHQVFNGNVNHFLFFNVFVMEVPILGIFLEEDQVDVFFAPSSGLFTEMGRVLKESEEVSGIQEFLGEAFLHFIEFGIQADVHEDAVVSVYLVALEIFIDNKIVMPNMSLS